jgi:arylsulfatase A-like enzyme
MKWVAPRRGASARRCVLVCAGVALLLAAARADAAPTVGRLVGSRAELNQVALSGGWRYALPGNRLRFPVRLAPGAALRTAFGVRREVAADAARQPVEFTVSLLIDGQRKQLLFRRKVVGAAALRWSDIRLTLRRRLKPDGEVEEGELVADLLLEAAPLREPIPEESIVWAAPRIEPAPRGDGPNLILLSIDTLRADHLGCYGYERATSPNLDRLASEGVLFERAISSSSWTLPAHVSMLTGLNPPRHGAARGGRPLAERLDTVAELLWDHGYATAAYTGHLFVTAEQGFAQGFGRFRAALDSEQISERFGRKVESALDWMEQRRAERFFLFLHTYAVHLPYRPEPPYDQRFGTECTGRYETCFDNADYTESNDGHDLTETELRQVQALYDGGIAETDAVIAELLSGLQARGLAQSTCLVVTSDHGEEFREHGDLLHHHAKLFDELVHVPLIVWCPREIKAPRRVDSLVSLVDVAPTLLALAGVEAPPGLDGVDLSPLWRGETNSVRQTAFSEVDMAVKLASGKNASLRNDRYKLITSSLHGQRQLFDLSVDPGETADVSAEQPQMVKKLLKEIRAQQRVGRLDRVARDAESVDADVEISPADLERMRALGYAP